MFKWLGFFLLFSFSLFAQDNFNFIQDKPLGIPVFDMSSFTYYNDQKEAVVNTWIRIENKSLQYVLEKSKYVSSFEITFALLDSKGSVLKNQTKQDGAAVKTFNETQKSGVYRIYTFQNNLAAGDYVVKVNIRDLNSNKTFDKINKITIPDNSQRPLVLSDIAIIETLSDTSNKEQIVPLVDDIVNNPDKGFSIFFEMYPQNIQDTTVRFVIELQNLRDKDESNRILLGTVDYKLDTRKKQQIFKQVDTKNIPAGDYSVIVTAKTKADVFLTKNSRNYSFGWDDVPTSEKDLDLAIDQLLYFAKTDVLNTMKEAKTLDEKMKLFTAFWERWDPSPGTTKNEMMEEYYRRVRVANKLFRAFKFEGWKTDRGMVYIMYGQPDFVDEKYSSSDMKPYEIWYYYDIHKKYYFMDFNGYGDYRLMNSLTGDSSDFK